MPITINFAQSISGGGLSISSLPISRTGSLSIGLEETLAAAQSGTLSTRTDDDTGTITMASGGHTITTGAVVDVYWSGGVQYGVTVGTVSGTSVPIDLGSGDNLPIATTVVTVVPQTVANVSIDGDNAKFLAIIVETNDKTLRTAAHASFHDAADDEIAEIDFVTNVPQAWDIEGGSANPFTGDPITYINVSNGGSSTTESYVFKILGVADASP